MKVCTVWGCGQWVRVLAVCELTSLKRAPKNVTVYGQLFAIIDTLRSISILFLSSLSTVARILCTKDLTRYKATSSHWGAYFDCHDGPSNLMSHLGHHSISSSPQLTLLNQILCCTLKCLEWTLWIKLYQKWNCTCEPMVSTVLSPTPAGLCVMVVYYTTLD